MSEQYVVGVDFGTLSGRAVVVRVSDGVELAPPGHVSARGRGSTPSRAPDARLPPEWALQVPDDYREVLRQAVPAALRTAASSRPT